VANGLILVVDDDEFIRDTLEVILEEEGYQVLVAEHGGQALELIETALPKVILLDLRMPVMDGWALAREIHERGLLISIIVMTAAQDAYSKADDIRVDAIFPKPFDLEELVQEVNRLAKAA
jgi:CheY-like chemotaxis protein